MKIVRPAILVASFLLSTSMAQAAPITLSDMNSVFSVDPGSQLGAFSWQVDGTEHLFKEWFWYRATGMSRERSLDQTFNGAAAAYTATASDSADADPADDKLVIIYDHNLVPNGTLSFRLQLEYDLDGSAGGSSTVSEKVTITNTSSSGVNLTFNLFEYSDFNVNGTAGDDTATLSGSSIAQTEAGPGVATVTSLSPVPDRYQIATVPANPTDPSILRELNDTGSDNLTNTGSPTGPDDVAFAFQWTKVVTPATPWVIDKQKSIVGSITTVPEPASLLLVATGLIATRLRQRYQARRTS
jgi:hypothetical protein